MTHLLTQGVLQLHQRLDHQLDTSQCLQDHTVLNTLLQRGLNVAIGLSHIARDGPHSIDVCTAEEDEGRQDDGHADGQRRIHGEEEEEGAEQAHQHGNELGKRVSDDSHHGLAVAHKSVQHITAVALLPAMPLTTQQVFEETTLHALLGFDTQEGRHPAVRITQCQLQGHHDDQHHTSLEERRGAKKRGRGTARSYIDGVFRSPNKGEIQQHTCDAAHRVDERLQLHLLEDLPEPDEHLPCTISFLAFHSLTSVPHISFILNVRKKLWSGRFSILT